MRIYQVRAETEREPGPERVRILSTCVHAPRPGDAHGGHPRMDLVAEHEGRLRGAGLRQV